MDHHKQIVLEAADLRAMLEKAAEDGARRALAGVGLHDEDAADDVRDIRSLLADYRAVKRGIFTTMANAFVLGLLALIGTGLWWHVREQ